MCNRLFLLLVRLPANSRLLGKFLRSQSYMQIFDCLGWLGGGRVSTLTPMLFKNQLCLLNHVTVLEHRLSS